LRDGETAGEEHDGGRQMSRRDVVDIGPERLRRKAEDLYVECPRCGELTFMRHTRCQACGLWFQGEAFQFAPSDVADVPRQRPWVRAAGRTILVLLGVLILVALAALVSWTVR